MKKLLFASFLLSVNIFAHDLNIYYSKDITTQNKKALELALEEVANFLPQKFKDGLPENLVIKVASLTNHKEIPDEVCSKVLNDSLEQKNEKKEIIRPFVYGNYNQYKNTLTINTPVLQELSKGRDKSKRINCQHKSLYDQAIATIVHELTHAYDFNNGRISNSIDFMNRAGFKKGLLKARSKNVQAMRSADAYELVNIAESFAVNMEYFTMDPEFLCRKPSMFNYFKQLFSVDPYPSRACKINNAVMVSSPGTGYTPTVIDPNRVYRIDYLMASAGKGIESGFGHSMFRIVMCAPERFDPITKRLIPATLFGKKCLEDKLFHLVVSYRANVEDAKLNYVKGLLGGYPSMLFILNFSDVLDEYNRDELRDVISYPLLLTSKEREDFILKMKDEHWNYRGSYKFINNNCAVESYDLLRSSLDRAQLSNKWSVTPDGVLQDLDKLNFLSVRSEEVETFKAKTNQIILAYKTAYGHKLKNEKDNKKAVQKFIDESTVNFRLSQFEKLKNSSVGVDNLYTEVTLLKERQITASSFSVMEQQILRVMALKYRKLAAEKFMYTEDEKLKALVKETGAAFSQSFKDLSKNGYGIPFNDEMLSHQDLANKITNGAEVTARAEIALKELMPAEFSNLEKISVNIKIFNNYSLQIRKLFRTKLDAYIAQVLKNLSTDDYTLEVLKNAGNGDQGSLKKVRDLLGKDLVSEKEILDSKLLKLIQDYI